ncbi:hypothetical protein RBS60_06820 [Sinomonas sp. ASV486]|uniref:hypothetical protein n=1 Tax=Sinomonas sp. ASV486 TaxID=3051170 RepID=UPI0027DC8A64|nr:hypothetical protein [Sinomonas sp. ASV486]MDQ4489908.1 hypothetical protein [Sinomonas sp. ASV486]
MTRRRDTVPAPGSLRRSLRTTALGGSVTALAAGAHAWAGGDLPHPLILGALVALTVLVSAAVARLPLRLPGLIAALGAGQVVLHEAFTALAPAGAAAPSAASALARGRHQHSADALSALESLGAEPSLSAANDHASPLMLGLHIAATLACALAIRKVEQALAAMAEWLRPLTHLPEPVAVMPSAPPRPFAAAPVRHARTWRELAPPPQRGPPRAAPAFA